MGLAFEFAQRVLGADTVAPIRLLARDSLRLLVRRVGRILRTAAAMQRGDLVPPPPMRLQVETVDICNLKCRMCSREVLDGMNTRTMPLAEFTTMVDDIEPYYVTMNGLGEPLLDKTIVAKLAALRERGIMSSMPTNGTYLEGERRERLAPNLPDVLQLSIDGATKASFEAIRVDGDFDAIVRNYRGIVEMQREGRARAETRIRILCALQRGNLRDFRAMHQLVRSMPGIASFELVPVFDYDESGGKFAELIPSADEVRAVRAELDTAIAATDDDGERAFYRRWRYVASAWNGDGNRPQPTEPSHHACVVPWYNAYVDAKGRVYPSCYLLSTQHVMGNVQHQSFTDIWAGDTYRSFRQRIMSDRANLEGCRTCSRNDDRRLRQLRRVRPLLAAMRTARPAAKPARTLWIRQDKG